MFSRNFGYPVAVIEERFWARVEKTSECWLWLGRRMGKLGNYGAMAVKPRGRRYRTMAAHRIAYKLLVGEIPAGLVLDHLCCQTLCVNPGHLEPVTPEENGRRFTERRLAQMASQ